jgi:hypothetical protein
MTAFYYFLSGETEASIRRGADKLAREPLVARHLADVLEDVHRIPDEGIVANTPVGPDGNKGVVLYPLPTTGDVPPVLGLDQEKQTWTRIDDSLYLGWLNDAPPRPTDLERRELVDGYSVTDAAGDAWQVPTLRAVDNPRGRLPASFNWSDTRQPEIGVARKYRKLWQQSETVWNLMESVPVSLDRPFAHSCTAEQDLMLYRYVIDALSINYRVSNIELSVLDQIRPDWLSGKTARLMLDATVDLFLYRRWLEAEKKTDDLSTPEL